MPLLDHIENRVVTGIQCNYMAAGLGRQISRGVLENPVQFRTHGGRPADIALGRTPIDVAFIAAPSADPMGNCTGKFGKSACGSLGYAFADAMYAKIVVVITDNLVPYPMTGFSISEDFVDFVVEVDAIGDPKGIVSGTTKITRDPVGLVMASHAARVIEHSGLLKDGFSFQTGAGGASLAAAKFLKEIMLKKGIQGSFGMGGITGYMVEMLKTGCFRSLLDVQCFDLDAVESIRSDPRHREVSAMQYASPAARSAAVDSLDVVILGATEIDTEFNVNVHTDSNGYIMGGSGGHSDTAAGAKLSMIIAPMFRARLPIVTDRVNCISTPGRDIDVLVTQGGIAVNPKNGELKQRLTDAGLPIIDILALKEKAEAITGKPKALAKGSRPVAQVIYRDGSLLDTIYDVK
jgi:citrate lyase subunit alpha/citrate CoA-transferase